MKENFYFDNNHYALQRLSRLYSHQARAPLGCCLYPVVYLADEGAIVDESCPMGQTISEQELRTKGKTLNKLLKKIDNESARQFSSLLD